MKNTAACFVCVLVGYSAAFGQAQPSTDKAPHGKPLAQAAATNPPSNQALVPTRKVFANGYWAWVYPETTVNGVHYFSNGYSMPVNNGYWYPRGTAPAAQQTASTAPAQPPPGSTVLANGYWYPPGSGPAPQATAGAPAQPPAGSTVMANGYYYPPGTAPAAQATSSAPAQPPAGSTVMANGYYYPPGTAPAAQATSSAPAQPPAGSTVAANGYWYSNGYSIVAPVVAPTIVNPINSYSGATSAPGSNGGPTTANQLAGSSVTAGVRVTAISSNGTIFYSNGTSVAPNSTQPSGNPATSSAVAPTIGTNPSTAANSILQSQPIEGAATATSIQSVSNFSSLAGKSNPGAILGLPATSIGTAPTLTPEQQHTSDMLVQGVQRYSAFLKGAILESPTAIPLAGVAAGMIEDQGQYDRKIEPIVASYIDSVVKTESGRQLLISIGEKNSSSPISNAISLWEAHKAFDATLENHGVPPELLGLILSGK